MNLQMASINVEDAVFTQEQQDAIAIIIVGSYLNSKHPHLMTTIGVLYSTSVWFKRKSLEAPSKVIETLIYGEIGRFGRDLLEGFL